MPTQAVSVSRASSVAVMEPHSNPKPASPSDPALPAGRPAAESPPSTPGRLVQKAVPMDEPASRPVSVVVSEAGQVHPAPAIRFATERPSWMPTTITTATSTAAATGSSQVQG